MAIVALISAGNRGVAMSSRMLEHVTRHVNCPRRAVFFTQTVIHACDGRRCYGIQVSHQHRRNLSLPIYMIAAKPGSQLARMLS